MTLQHARLLNIVLTLLGVIVFGTILAYINLAPSDFDQKTRQFAISQVESELDDNLGRIAQSKTMAKMSDLAGKVSKSLKNKVDHARQALDGGIDVLIADILAAACRLDCDRREEARLHVREFFESKIAQYDVAIDRLERIVVNKYDEVMSELRRDLSIFSGTNAIVMAFALIITLIRGAASRHLLPISIILTSTTLLMIIWYIFGQDWVMTIILNDYWGWAYAFVMAFLAIFLIDIAVNKARITSFVLNAIGSVLGNAFHVSPC